MFPAACCARKTTPASAKNYGAMPCGRRLTSPEVVVAHLAESSANTSNNKKHRTELLRGKDGYTVRAIHLRSSGRGFARNLDKASNLCCSPRNSVPNRIKHTCKASLPFMGEGLGLYPHSCFRIDCDHVKLTVYRLNLPLVVK